MRARSSAAPGPCDLRSRFPNEQLREAWVELLGRLPWEWFCTLTFREDRVHPERGDKAFRLWLSKLHEAVFGRRWYRKGRRLSWARGSEAQNRGSLHYHVLLTGVGEVRRLTFMDLWNELAGLARIRPVRRQDLVAKYVTKYVAKGGVVDIGGPWPDRVTGSEERLLSRGCSGVVRDGPGATRVHAVPHGVQHGTRTRAVVEVGVPTGAATE